MAKTKYFNTPRGRFIIHDVIESRQKAEEQGYGYYFTHDQYDVFTFHLENNCCHFALVPNGR